MSIRQEILNTPEALRATLEEGRPEFEALIRRTRWNERPIFLIGSGWSYVAALAGARAFESLLGTPAVVRSSLDFSAYSAGTLERRSVLLAASQSGESAATIEAVRGAKRRGAVVLAVTGSPESTLARLADGVFLVRAGEEPEPRVRTVLCQQAALLSIAVLAAGILRRPDPQVEALEREFHELPGQIEWALTQIRDGARMLASQVREAQGVRVAGAGFYRPTALAAARLLRTLAKIRAACFDPDGENNPQRLDAGSHAAFAAHSSLLALSGSRCRMKETIRLLASAWRGAGAQVLAVTDAADRELSAQSSLAVILPAASEIAGSVLTLAVLGWTAYEISRSQPAQPGGVAG